MHSLIITLAVVLVVNQCNAQADQQYRSVRDLPNDVYRLKLDGLVHAVFEGDSFHFFHTPNPNAPVGRISIRDTMIMKLVGIDAPEMTRPGVPGQPFSQQAKDRLARLILNKRVTVELFGRKSDDEVWASVNVYGENVSVKLVQEGLAKTLIDRSAVYGDVRSQLFKAETQAKSQRFGIWSL